MQQNFSLQQVKSAFWKVFYRSGEHFFPYDIEEDCDREVDSCWDDFAEALGKEQYQYINPFTKLVNWWRRFRNAFSEPIPDVKLCECGQDKQECCCSEVQAYARKVEPSEVPIVEKYELYSSIEVPAYARETEPCKGSLIK